MRFQPNPFIERIRRAPLFAASVQSGENNNWTYPLFCSFCAFRRPRLTNGVLGPIIIMGVRAAKSLPDSEKAFL